MNVALIPARGGSKGIPLKNLQTVNGESLLSRTIKAANNSNKIDLVFVSSELEEILDHATSNGAIAIRRHKDLSLDTTSTEPVLIATLTEIEKKIGTLKLMVLLQCTSAFTTPGEIDIVVNTLEENIEVHDAAFAASDCHSFIWKYDKIKKEARGVNHTSNSPRERRQDITDKQYLETGSVYAIKRDSLINSGSRFGKNPLPVAVSSINSYLEIDTFEDLKIANLIASNNHI